MANRYGVRIDGLREFTARLRAVDRNLPKGLRVAMNDSAKVVVEWAAPRVPRRSGRAMRSLKAGSTRAESRVVGGGNRVPYYPWLDFGGRVGIRRSVARPWLPRGRYIFEGFYQNRDEFTEILGQSLERLAVEAGLDVTSGQE